MLKSLWRIAIGKPCVGKLQARFDEGPLETRGSKSRGAPAAYSAKEIILAIALIAVAAPARAQQETAAFLKVGIGARAVGMGGAYTAIANDVNAMAWNPAGLGAISRKEFGLMDAELAQGVRLDYLGYAQPTPFGTFGAGAIRLSQGALEGRDAAGHPVGGFTAADTAVNLSYGYKVDYGTRLGGNIKYIQSQIANASAQTYAIDLGAMRELEIGGPGLPILAVAVQNLGPGMKFLDQTSKLPLAVSGGLGYRLPVGLTFALDVKNRPNSHTTEVAFGTEYGLFSNFALRGGYGTAQAGGTAAKTGGTAALNGMAMGFGLKFHSYNLDYAITPFGELGNVQRFSLGARFK